MVIAHEDEGASAAFEAVGGAADETEWAPAVGSVHKRCSNVDPVDTYLTAPEQKQMSGERHRGLLTRIGVLL